MVSTWTVERYKEAALSVLRLASSSIQSHSLSTINQIQSLQTFPISSKSTCQDEVLRRLVYHDGCRARVRCSSGSSSYVHIAR